MQWMSIWQEHCSEIKVTLEADGILSTVEDNGRGIPVGMHEKGSSGGQTCVYRTLHAGGKFDDSAIQDKRRICTGWVLRL